MLAIILSSVALCSVLFFGIYTIVSSHQTSKIIKTSMEITLANLEISSGYCKLNSDAASFTRGQNQLQLEATMTNLRATVGIYEAMLVVLEKWRVG